MSSFFCFCDLFPLSSLSISTHFLLYFSLISSFTCFKSVIVRSKLYLRVSDCLFSISSFYSSSALNTAILCFTFCKHRNSFSRLSTRFSNLFWRSSNLLCSLILHPAVLCLELSECIAKLLFKSILNLLIVSTSGLIVFPSAFCRLFSACWINKVWTSRLQQNMTV